MDSDSKELPKLPIIDFFGDNLNPGTNSWLTACNDIRRALEEYGCFIAVYPDVSQEVDDAVFGSMKDLFSLPKETKAQNINVKPLYGYLGEKPPLPAIHESMGIENAQNLEETQNFTKLMWPEGNNRFCENMHKYANLVRGLDRMVKRMVMESYGLGKYFESFIDNTNYLLRLIKYRAPQGDECSIGAHCHTDKGIMTIVHQNQVNGLQIKTRDGDWIGFESIPSSFIVFAGDALLAWSNGRIHSPQHQVIMKETEARYSIGFFSFCNDIVKVPEELVDDEHPLQFNPFDNFGLLNFFVSDHDIDRKSRSCVRAYCGI